MNTYEIIKQAQDDLRYLGRLNQTAFAELLFPDSIESYVEPKWDLFRDDILAFLWSCSHDKIKILAQFIDSCKRD